MVSPSSSKQTEDITEVLVKIENLLSKQNRTENRFLPLTMIFRRLALITRFLLTIQMTM